MLPLEEGGLADGEPAAAIVESKVPKKAKKNNLAPDHLEPEFEPVKWVATDFQGMLVVHCLTWSQRGPRRLGACAGAADIGSSSLCERALEAARARDGHAPR